MAQQFASRSPHSRDSNDPYDSAGNVPSAPNDRSAKVSQDADKTLGNIDKALRDQEESAGLYNSTGEGKAKSADSLAKAETGGGLKNRILGGRGKGVGGKITARLKKRLAIGAIALLISIVISILTFFALLPLKIETLVNNLETRFTATSQQALNKETTNLFDKWVKKDIFPNLNKGTCHTTVDPSCVSVDKGSGPIHKVFEGWRQGHLEQKLATKYDLAFAKQGTHYYINTNGSHIDIGDGSSIFGDAHTSAGTRSEIEVILSNKLKEGTLWDKLYFRFKVLPFLKNKYGLRYCLEKCHVVNKFSDSLDIKRKAALAWTVQRVVTPLSQNYGDIIQCVIISADYCSTSLDPANPGDEERSSAFQRQFSSTLDSLAARYSSDELADLVEKAKVVSDEGFSRFVVKEVVSKIAGAYGGDAIAAEGVGDAAAKAVGPIAWTFFIAKIIHTASTIGPTIRIMGYAANAAAAVATYHMFSTATSELKSGGIDATEIGSLNDALSSNMTGSSTDRSDATQTPLYAALNNQPQTSTTALSNLLPGQAFAASTQPKSVYLCNDGNPVPKGSIVCPEEVLDRGNSTLNFVSDFTNSIPGLSLLAGLVTKIGDLVGGAFSSVFAGLCKITPGCSSALGYVTGLISSAITPLLNWLINTLIGTPISHDMSGGRTYDMMAAGADIEGNGACELQLGCKRIPDKQAYAMQAQALSEQQHLFEQQSFFARMLDGSSPYSFVSRLSLVMPSSLTTAGQEVISSIITNPLNVFGHAFASLFSGRSGFAASALTTDPFGVLQYGYDANEIPADPEAYWNANCASHYDDTTNKLDITDWLNSQVQDPGTGEGRADNVNACMLLFATFQSSGGLFDPSLLPQGSSNTPPGAGGTAP